MGTAANPAGGASPQPRRHRGWRIAGYVLLGLVVLAAVLVGGFAWYASTPGFENKVRGAVIAELEKVTGGKVDLAAFRWRLTHLEFEADDLTIHGLEGPKEIPYAHVDRLFVRIKIISLFRAKVGLNYLGLTHPVVHLIVYPDGSTNQPTPKVKSTSNKSVKDEIFDLAVDRTELTEGVAILNERKMSFNLAANDLAVAVTYARLRDHYLGSISAANITAQRGRSPVVHSKLEMQLDVGRNTANLQGLHFQSGASSLEASGSVNDFASPHWQVSAKGAIDLREVNALAEVPGVEGGTIDLQVKGNGTKMLFAVQGQTRIRRAVYRTASVRVAGLDAEAAFRATQDEIDVNGLRARFATGGVIDGDVRIVNWETPAPSGASARTAATRTAAERGDVHLKLGGFTVPAVLAMVAPPKYGDLGFDTAAEGAVSAEWTGSMANISATANLKLAPYRQPAANEVPVNGVIDATYSQPRGIADVRELLIQTPGTQLHVAGTLGIYPATRGSQINVDLTTNNLGEFDRTLAAAGVASKNKTGVQALPVQLHGGAQFHGTVTGTISAPDVKGHLQANDFDLVLTTPPASGSAPGVQTASMQAPAAIPGAPTNAPPVQTIHWDSLSTDAEYTPQRISITIATLMQGKTSIQVSGQLRAHRLRGGKTAFDDDAGIDANVRVQNADVGQLLAIAGENLPVSGTLNAQAQAGGQLGNLNGGGHVAVKGGKIYGEPYRSLNTDLRFAGKEFQLANLVFLEDGGRITASGSYNPTQKQFQFAAQGSNFQLAHFQRLKNSKYPIGGVLGFDAHGSGTPTAPRLAANVHLTQLSYTKEITGNVELTAHTQAGALVLTVDAHVNQGTLEVSGQTELKGNYNTQARLSLTNLDLNPILRAFNVNGAIGQAPLGASLTVHGPLKEPKQLNADLTVNQLAMSLDKVPIKSSGPMHATLQNGTLHLDRLHISGEDTTLDAQGSAGLFTAARELDAHADGSLNVKIAQTFSNQVLSSGHITFKMDAAGTTKVPDLTGEVKFNDVNFAMEDYINGLSHVNGSLVFDQDRLDFQNFTAYSGGGPIQITGFASYHQGLYADLLATAKGVRIRYPEGVTAMVDAKIRLQGTQSNLLVSGNAQLVRFTISPDLDFAALSTTAGGVSLPPNPDSFTNHIRLDLHLTSAPQLDFENSYAKLAGNVDLRVRGTVEQPTVLGRISVTEGNATFAGTKYELQHGDIYFSNPIRIEPVLDLDATAHIENYDITIGLHGTIDKLTPVFRSEPPLSEQDIFSLLALGRTQEEQQIYSQEEQQAGVNSTADALLGGAINATVSSRIQKLFGGGSVKIDPTYVSNTGDATARITVQQQISKNATLTYATNVNSTAEQLIQGEVNLTENLSVLAVRDESGVFSLELRLRRRYR